MAHPRQALSAIELIKIENRRLRREARLLAKGFGEVGLEQRQDNIVLNIWHPRIN